MTKTKTGSSSSGSSDSSDSEDSENGTNSGSMVSHSNGDSSFNIPLMFVPTGQVPKQQKSSTNKDNKRPHHQPLAGGAGTVAPQAQPLVVQSKPPFVPPVPAPVTALDASHLLTSGFDPLAHFMNPHLTQSNTQSSSAVTAAGAPVASGLLNTNTPGVQTPTETHPFLNQHSVIPAPGVCSSGAPCSKSGKSSIK